MNRREQLTEVFKDVDAAEKTVVDCLLDEVVFLELRMAELKKMPFVRQHPKHPEMQKTTSAAKLYKECSQSYMNAVRILIGILRKTDTSAQDKLAKILEEFS